MAAELATLPPSEETAKIELIRKMVAKDCTNDELDLFLYTCKRTGLDPLARQIYAVKRSGKMSIQTGIDGYRLIADRTGKLAGISDYLFDTDTNKSPGRATVTVKKLLADNSVAEFTATARWAEYQAGGPMWAKMPYLMLGKCAEALALRKAFPADLSGVYTSEEMAQADSSEQQAAVYAEVARQQAQSSLPASTVPPELDWSYNQKTGVLICRPVDVEKRVTKGANPKEFVAVKLNGKAQGKDMAFCWSTTAAPALLSSIGKIIKVVALLSSDSKFLNIDEVLEVDGNKIESADSNAETQARLLASVLEFTEEELDQLYSQYSDHNWETVLSKLQELRERRASEVAE